MVSALLVLLPVACGPGPATPGPSAGARAHAVRPPRPATAKSKPARGARFVQVPLDGLFNNDAIASEVDPLDGNFDIPEAMSGDTYPWAGMPRGGSPFAPSRLKGVTFRFPDYSDGKKNNVACAGQKIDLGPASYRVIYILGASEKDSQVSTLTLLTRAGEKTVPFRLTDWCQPVKFGELPVLKWDHRIDFRGKREETACAMFVQTIRLDAPTRLEGLRLPQNPRVHIFALTLEK